MVLDGDSAPMDAADAVVEVVGYDSFHSPIRNSNKNHENNKEKKQVEEPKNE